VSLSIIDKIAALMLHSTELTNLSEQTRLLVTVALKAFRSSLVLGPSLILLYVAAFSLALGKLLYSIRCPKRVKRHGSYTSYVSNIAEIADALSSITAQRTKSIVGLAGRDLELHLENRGALQSASPQLLEALKRIASQPATEEIERKFDAQVTRLLTDHQNEWRRTIVLYRFSRYAIVGFYCLSGLCASILFFVLAPIHVCAATILAARCEAITDALSQKLPNF
jgi:hypothetical protein